MIKNSKRLEEFERQIIQDTPTDFHRNLAIVEALLEEARALGVWPPEDPMEGIETDIRVAQILNGVYKPDKPA